MRLSTHDPANKEKYVDNPEAWKNSEKVIHEVLDELALPYELGR